MRLLGGRYGAEARIALGGGRRLGARMLFQEADRNVELGFEPVEGTTYNNSVAARSVATRPA
ncbi:MAG: hypothetical protein A3I01_09800 [Betaproteobacteria bacterium RIFCSPLOWO2_02_FULL_65_24]|nr:MAG: hypothetical protein A3I01_09800 [Betaproteobacteria bacterium RIFCSPLOWO2_02_FULL_65_24]